ncbi:MAG: heme-copper oxidase subunit III [Myxococcota bacterium]|nr:heme-copper oxidase subunit III [Myxococcota bacterium]
MSAFVTSRNRDGLEPIDRTARKPVVPHGVLGMLLFVLTEIMVFSGLISAFTIAKASAPIWPPPGQPRLPVEATAFNSLILLASAVALIFAHRAFHKGDREGMRQPMWLALGLGSTFVIIQGYEWVRLLSEGLTMTSSSYGAFFYLIVGIHALHAFAAIGLLAVATLRLQSGWLTPGFFGATEIFWFFVVGVWPIIYFVVYL